MTILEIFFAEAFREADIERCNQFIGLLACVVGPCSLLVGELCGLACSLHLVDHQEITGGVIRDGKILVVLSDLALVARGLAVIIKDILGGALDGVGHLRVAGIPVQGAY